MSKDKDAKATGSKVFKTTMTAWLPQRLHINLPSCGRFLLELTREMLEEFIQVVRVYDNGALEIVWNFEDYIKPISCNKSRIQVTKNMRKE